MIAILFSAFVLVSPSANAYLVMDNPSAITTQQDVMPFSVYPNPLTSKKLVVNVDFEETTVPVTFTISNVLGQAVFTYKLSSDDYKNGSFEVLGRFDHSDIRGCNLLV